MSAYDKYLTIFSPEGRLHQIEYAHEAVKSAELTAVGVKGAECVVLICQKKTDDPKMDNKLLDHSSVTRLFPVTKRIGSVVVGSIADGRRVITRARQEASSFYYDNGQHIPVKLLARRIADKNQSNTQHAGARTMGIDAIICCVDEETGPELYKIDPAGDYKGYKAVASGKLAESCERFFRESYQKEDKVPKTVDECVQLGIMALLEAAKIEFTAKTLEVGVLSGETNFEVLSEKEIEKILTNIAERE